MSAPARAFAFRTCAVMSLLLCAVFTATSTPVTPEPEHSCVWGPYYDPDFPQPGSHWVGMGFTYDF